MARKLVVEIVGDASSLDRSFKKASRSANEFDRDMGRVVRGTIAGSGAFRSLGRSVAFASAGFLGGVGFSALLRSAISEASDLEQQVGKTNVVFGSSAAEVQDWAKTLAESFGLSRREALSTASSFGALFAPIGLTGQVAAEQSEKLTELGSDLASFYNTDVASALDAIRSGLVGESEPLRKYGVLLSETRVQQEALNETGKKSAKNLTDQEKVLARVALIFKDSKQAQGDFGRTADTAANQAKILQANIANLRAEMGARLIPVLNNAATALNDFFRALSGTPVEGTVKGESVEKILVPLMAKRIAAMKKAGKSAKEQLEVLRELVGDSQKANDLIAEAFRFASDPQLQARIQGREFLPAGALGPVLPEPPPPPETAQQRRERLARIRQARAAVREEREERARLAVERTAITETVADDIAALRQLNALLERRIRGGHDVIANEREQIAVQLQINALLKQQAEARAEQARQARDARQFRLLGFGPTGEELIPGVGGLKRQLESVRDVIAGSFLDTRKTRGLLAHIRQILAGGLGSVSAEVRARIKEILDDLRDQLRRSSVDVTRFQKTARGQFVLAGAHPGGVTVYGGVHLHGVQDVPGMENAITKRSKQRAHQRRSTR